MTFYITSKYVNLVELKMSKLNSGLDLFPLILFLFASTIKIARCTTGAKGCNFLAGFLQVSQMFLKHLLKVSSKSLKSFLQVSKKLLTPRP